MTSITRSRIRKVGLMAFMAPCGSRDTVAPRYGRWRLLESFANVVRSIVWSSICIDPATTYSGGLAIIANALPSVVLPQPDSPARPTICPSGTSIVTLSTAGTSCPVSAAYTAVTLLARMRIPLTKGPRPSRSARPACGPSRHDARRQQQGSSSCRDGALG